MEFIFAWVVFAAASGAVAKGKNRSIPLWIFLGVLLGPIAILIVALMKTAPGPDQGYN